MVMPTLRRDWTVEERDALPDDGNRYEVIDGELVVTPAPAWRHQGACLELARLFADYLDRERIGYVFGSPIDVVFSRRRALQPDLAVVPPANGRRPENFRAAGRLLLAVEVLSPSTARVDRIHKRRVFQEERVPEYWIVDLDARVIERTTPTDPRPEVLGDRLEWSPEGASELLVIDLAKYFAKVLDE